MRWEKVSRCRCAGTVIKPSASCCSRKRCVNPDSSHVKSQCRTVLATSNAITCLWHCGKRHRGGRTVIQARWRNVGSRSRNAKGNAESDGQCRSPRYGIYIYNHSRQPHNWQSWNAANIYHPWASTVVLSSDDKVTCEITDSQRQASGKRSFHKVSPARYPL